MAAAQAKCAPRELEASVVFEERRGDDLRRNHLGGNARRWGRLRGRRRRNRTRRQVERYLGTIREGVPDQPFQLAHVGRVMAAQQLIDEPKSDAGCRLDVAILTAVVRLRRLQPIKDCLRQLLNGHFQLRLHYGASRP